MSSSYLFLSRYYGFLFFTDPRIPDPYECRLVEVRSSEIEGGNEGLFAKRFLEVNKALFCIFVFVYL